MAHLVTGYAGKEHIKSADQGSFNAAFFGTGEFVMSIGKKFKGTIANSNTVRISDGDMLMQGRHIRIEPGSYEDVTIMTGTSGMNRIDLIVMTYEKDASTGKESAYLEVVKGDSVSGNPAEPTIITGDILNGALKNQMPLYAVYISGVALSKISTKFSVCPTYKELAEQYAKQFQTACNTYLGALNIIDSSSALMSNTKDKQLAGALAVKNLMNSHVHDTRYNTKEEIANTFRDITKEFNESITDLERDCTIDAEKKELPVGAILMTVQGMLEMQYGKWSKVMDTQITSKSGSSLLVLHVYKRIS